MKYLKKNKWQKKSPFSELIEEFQKEERLLNLDDEAFLLKAREIAESWISICNYPEIFHESQINIFKALVVDSVQKQWGRCNFDFDQFQQKIFVTSFDGRAMELVSGNIFSEAGVTQVPKNEKKPSAADPKLLSQMENACNDWLTWLENTK